MPVYPARLYPAQSVDNLDGSDGFRVTSQLSVGLGYTVASGDFNGDGFSDIAMAAPAFGIFVIYGSSVGPPEEVDFLAPGAVQSSLLTIPHSWTVGTSMASGDFRGDSYEGLIFVVEHGAEGYSEVVIQAGGPGGFGSTVDLAEFAFSRVVLRDDAVLRNLEVAVASGSDLNGDGRHEAVIGVPRFDGAGVDDGAVYVVIDPTNMGDGSAFSVLNGVNGFRISGAGTGALLGQSISGAGDVNGDGFEDLIIGAPGIDAAYLIYSRSGGFPADIDLSQLSAAEGAVIHGIAGTRFGWAVDGAGDLNNDGFDDVVIGAPDDGGLEFHTWDGAAYVVFGGLGGMSPVVGVEALDGDNGFKLSIGSTGGNFGLSVAGAGDIDGDGIDDLLVGNPFSPNAHHQYPDTGDAFLVLGRSTLFEAAPDIFDDLGGVSSGFHILGGSTETTAFGFAVATAGDMNGDGANEVLAAGLNRGAVGFSGIAAVLYGIGHSTNFTGGAGDDTADGGTGADRLIGGAGKDVLNGLAGTDQLFGDDGNDRLSGGIGADFLSGGAGADVLDGGTGDDIIIDVSGANKLTGGAGDDQLTGGSGADRMEGGLGYDILIGGEGNDYLDNSGWDGDRMLGGAGNDIYIVGGPDAVTVEAAGEGQDTVRLGFSYTLVEYTYTLAANVENLELPDGYIQGVGNDLDNIIKGGAGINLLWGNAGNDRLFGGDETDLLYGGAGRDQLTGGTGVDRFIVEQQDINLTTLEIDTITDYERSIDLLGFTCDANINLQGEQDFVLAPGGFTRVAGQLFYFYTAATNTTTIRLDVNGDARADYQLVLKGGDFTSSASDWLL